MPAFLLLIVLLALGFGVYEFNQPLAVRELRYSAQGTELMLARKTVLNLEARFEPASLLHTDRLFIDARQHPSGEVLDRLRGRPLACGAVPCLIDNPVVAELRSLDEQLTAARTALASSVTQRERLVTLRQQKEAAFEAGQCRAVLDVKPPDRHALACEPPNARSASEGLCLVLTFGPDACAKMAGEEVFSRIAASEVCSTAAAAVLDEARSGADRETDAILGLLSEGSSAVLNAAKEGNIFAWLLVPHAAAVKLAEMQRKQRSFEACIPKAMTRCSTLQARWEAEMSRFRDEHGPAIAACGALAEARDQLGADIDKATRYQAELDSSITTFVERTSAARSRVVVPRFP